MSFSLSMRMPECCAISENQPEVLTSVLENVKSFKDKHYLLNVISSAGLVNHRGIRAQYFGPKLPNHLTSGELRCHMDEPTTYQYCC